MMMMLSMFLSASFYKVDQRDDQREDDHDQENILTRSHDRSKDAGHRVSAFVSESIEQWTIEQSGTVIGIALAIRTIGIPAKHITSLSQHRSELRLVDNEVR